jgi:hypothetical protein
MNYKEAKHYFNYEIGEEATEIFIMIAQNENLKGLKYVQKLTNCSDEVATQIWEELKKEYGTPEKNPAIPNLTPQQIAQANAQAQEWLNKPKCPTCGSLKVEKISTGKKVFGGAMFGLFSSDVRNTMHCKNCGYKW